jgi:hypothetical protein
MYPLLSVLLPIAPTLLTLYLSGIVFGLLLYIAIDHLADVANRKLGLTPHGDSSVPVQDIEAQLGELRRKMLVNGRRALFAIEATVAGMTITGLSFTHTWSPGNAVTAVVLILAAPVLILGPSSLMFYVYHRWKLRRAGGRVPAA